MNIAEKISVCIFAALCLSANVYAESSIIVIAKDKDGWASGNAYLKKEKVWVEAGVETRKFEPFSHLVLSEEGTAVFSVSPGKYKVIVYYNETAGPSPAKHSDEFLVAGEDEVIKELYFEKTDINVVAKDSDGSAAGKVYLKKEKVWLDDGIEKRRFESFSHLVLSEEGTAAFSVPPGKYKVTVYYNETDGPSPAKHSDEFLVAGEGEVIKELYFEKGEINVEAKDNDGRVVGKAYLKKEKLWLDDGIEKRKFEPFSHRALSNGAAVFFVPPGKYKLIMYHNNRIKYPNSIELTAHAVDRDVITMTMDFTDGDSTFENSPTKP